MLLLLLLMMMMMTNAIFGLQFCFGYRTSLR